MGIIRKTKSVLAILEVFERNTHALSSVELVEQLKNSMNKSTVYRILERLEDDGILHSFIGEGGLNWYALNDNTSKKQTSLEKIHPHFQCSGCGQTQCLQVEVVLPAISDFHIQSATFLMVGTCPDCLT